RRTFAIYKLLPYLDNIKNIKEYLTPLNKGNDFSNIESYLKIESLSDEYESFLKGVGKFALHR
ncbi:hypothetical protein, partial [Brachyspira sp.]|uniref:hypothetical protein n=1 Tax=Brachyspira sp. TaxID=1977261 RepID=UPI00262E329B